VRFGSGPINISALWGGELCLVLQLSIRCAGTLRTTCVVSKAQAFVQGATNACRSLSAGAPIQGDKRLLTLRTESNPSRGAIKRCQLQALVGAKAMSVRWAKWRITRRGNENKRCEIFFLQKHELDRIAFLAR